jgi:hypothetical protein
MFIKNEQNQLLNKNVPLCTVWTTHCVVFWCIILFDTLQQKGEHNLNYLVNQEPERPPIRSNQRPSTVSQKFCSQKWQGKSLKLRSIFDPLPRDTEIRSTKSEIRNNLKTTMSKIQNKLQPSHGFLFWSFVF